MTATLDRLDAAAADGSLAIDVRRGGVQRDIMVRPVIGCATRFETRESRRVDAQADGGYVVATTGLVDFAANGDERAAALAHELAHDILGHRQRLRDAHVTRRIAGQFGRSARLTREAEIAAEIAREQASGANGRPVARITIPSACCFGGNESGSAAIVCCSIAN